MPQMVRASFGRIVPAVPVRVGGRDAAARPKHNADQSAHERETNPRPLGRRPDKSDDPIHSPRQPAPEAFPENLTASRFD